MTVFAGWSNFYVIVGSSAGALIGLQFVVMTLITNVPVRPGQGQAGAAFATPTIIHFGTVLLLSAILNAPWHGVATATGLACLLGLMGIVYQIIVTRRIQKQTIYTPEFEDWLFHVVLPIAAYLTLAISAGVAYTHLREALFGVGAAALMLLFTGIHNAWDAVTYHVFSRRGRQHEGER